MQLKISHTTSYSYDTPVDYALQHLRLTPKSRAGQTVIDWQTIVEGGQKELTFEDAHMNTTDLIRFDHGTRQIRVISSGIVDISDTSGVIGKHGGYLPLWAFERPTSRTRVGPLVRALAREVGADDDPLARLHRLSSAVLGAVRYDTDDTDVTSSAEEVLERGHGVCQDHAHIFLAAARHMGIPARYVSGYLMLNDREHQEATHAWAEAHVPSLGWVGFDVSNGISPDERYVRVATGLDYRDACPISGMRLGPGTEALDVAVQVQEQ